MTTVTDLAKHSVLQEQTTTGDHDNRHLRSVMQTPEGVRVQQASGARNTPKPSSRSWGTRLLRWRRRGDWGCRAKALGKPGELGACTGAVGGRGAGTYIRAALSLDTGTPGWPSMAPTMPPTSGMPPKQWCFRWTCKAILVHRPKTRHQKPGAASWASRQLGHGDGKKKEGQPLLFIPLTSALPMKWKRKLAND